MIFKIISETVLIIFYLIKFLKLILIDLNDIFILSSLIEIRVEVQVAKNIEDAKIKFINGIAIFIDVYQKDELL